MAVLFIHGPLLGESVGEAMAETPGFREFCELIACARQIKNSGCWQMRVLLHPRCIHKGISNNLTGSSGLLFLHSKMHTRSHLFVNLIQKIAKFSVTLMNSAEERQLQQELILTSERDIDDPAVICRVILPEQVHI